MAVRIQRTPSSSGSNSKFTFSAWVKRGTLGALSPMFSAGSSGQSQVVFTASDELAVYDGSTVILKTNRKFRDPSSFYHIVVTLDATQSGTDKAKLYVNGVQETSFATDGRSSFSSLAKANQSGEVQDIGSDGTGNFLGLMTHVHMTDNYAYQASTFGETDSTSGIWTPKTSPSVTYGTNGFFLKFENSGNMDLDSSGNNLSFTTAGNLTQNVDTPANNFATLTPLHVLGNVDLPALANGNLTYTGHSGTSYSGTFSTIAASSGKWYAEFKCTGGAGAVDMMIGAGMGTFNATAPGAGTGDMVVFGYDGRYYTNGSSTVYGDAWVSGDIIGIAMDLDNNKMYVRKNDSAWMNSGDPTSGSTGTGAIPLATSTTEVYHFLIGDYGGDGTPTCESNFGQGYFGTTQVASANADANGHGIFEYAVPSGYYALNTKNLKEFG